MRVSGTVLGIWVRAQPDDRAKKSERYADEPTSLTVHLEEEGHHLTGFVRDRRAAGASVVVLRLAGARERELVEVAGRADPAEAHVGLP